MKQLRFILTVVAALSLPSVTFAGVTMRWDVARARLAQDDPRFLALIETTFDICAVGTSSPPTNGIQDNTPISPYDFLGKPKGTKGPYTILIGFEPKGSSDKRWSAHIERINK